MPFNIGPIELIIVLAILLIVVGPGRLPDLGSAMGKTIREFRKASTDLTDATSLKPNTLSTATGREAEPALRGTPADAADDAP